MVYTCDEVKCVRTMEHCLVATAVKVWTHELHTPFGTREFPRDIRNISFDYRGSPTCTMEL